MLQLVHHSWSLYHTSCSFIHVVYLNLLCTYNIVLYNLLLFSPFSIQYYLVWHICHFAPKSDIIWHYIITEDKIYNIFTFSSMHLKILYNVPVCAYTGTGETINIISLDTHQDNIGKHRQYSNNSTNNGSVMEY
jgi:hypothetical protein